MIRRASCPPSISSGLVLGVEVPLGARVNHTSLSPYRLPLCAFSHSSSKRPWSLFLGFFVVLATLAPALNFLFGRIIVIDAFVSVRATDLPSFLYSLIIEQNQRTTYREVLIAGDLSQEDLDQATVQLGEFKVSQAVNRFGSACSNIVSRTFPKRGPCSHMAEARLKSPSSFTATTLSTSPNRVCPSLSLAALGLGLSTCRTWPVRRVPQTILFRPRVGTRLRAIPAWFYGMNRRLTKGWPDILMFAFFRHPQWGIRIRCEKLPDPEVNL